MYMYTKLPPTGHKQKTSKHLHYEHLAGPFSTKVDSFDIFLRCADSNGQLRISRLFFLSIPAADIGHIHVLNI